MLIPTPEKTLVDLLATLRAAPPQEEAKEKCGEAIYNLDLGFPKRFEVIQRATYEYNQRQVQFIVRLKSTETNEAIELALQVILDDIDELSKEEDRDGYIFKPTPHARKSAKSFIAEAYRKMEGKLPHPRIAPDGRGGIIMEWKDGENVVKLGCVSADSKRDYIYYRRGNIYDVVEASVDDLIKWLTN